MNRRKALTIAGTTAMVVAAGGIAMAANFGVLGVAGAGTGMVGSLESDTLAGLTTTTTQQPQIIVIDQYDNIAPDATDAPADDDSSGATSDESDHDDAGAVSQEREDQTDEAPAPAPPTTASRPTVTTAHDDDESEIEHEYEQPDVEHEDD